MNESPEQLPNDHEMNIDADERDDAVIGIALKWSLLVLVVVLAVGGSLVWWLTRPEEIATDTVSKIELPEIRELPPVEIPKMPFTDITKLAGIDFVHENGAVGDKLLPETMGGGCAFFDYDNDGDSDILFVNSTRWSWDKQTKTEPPTTLKLYRNDGTGQFENVTTETGLDVSCYGMGVAVGDYDNDGRVDLFVSAVGANRLFHNTGSKFIEVTETAGVAGRDNEWSTGCGWFDYDNDGDLDLMVVNYVVWSKEFDLAQPFQLDGGGRAYGRPQVFEGTFPQLYRNDGDGKFTDVSADAGLQVTNPATNVPLSKSLGLTFADFDNDGWLDVVVSNDTVQNLLFHNRSDGTFEEMGALSGVAFDVNGNARGAMGLDAARFRNDRSIGVAIGNYSNEMTALYVSQADGLQFSDEAIPTGLGPNTRLELTFGLFFFDCDLDGRLDLFAANGHLEEDINKVQASQFYEQSPQLFWNAGPEHATEFVPVPVEKCGDDFVRPMVGRGASYADIDGDGDLDILIATTGRAPRLLRNDQQTGNHWLRLKLVGNRSNRDGIGTKIEIYLKDRVLQRQVMPTRSYLSQVELPVTFGLGDAEKIEKVVICWPDGSIQELLNIEVDHLHIIEQPSAQ